MLWIHIGMPKTGTTALQGHLHDNAPFLARNGIRYMATGRDRGTGTARLICHNNTAMQMSRGWAAIPPDMPEAFVRECAAHAGQALVLSSEMFFGRDLSPLHRTFLSRVDLPVSFVVYLRRFDEFIEADYKQRAKNGLRTGGAAAFVAERLSRLESDPEFMNYASLFSRIEAQVPGARIVPRLYLRDEMVAGNVIPDFLSLLGVAPQDVDLPATPANRSLSRLASEALGLFDMQTAGLDKKGRRRLTRVLETLKLEALFGSHDVLLPQERARINALLEARNAPLRAAYFPGRDLLFPPRPMPQDARPRGHTDELAEFQAVMRAIMTAVRTPD